VIRPVREGVESAVVGDCPLCGATGVSLCDSHILPKWGYRRARDETRANGSPDPILFRTGGAVQTSFQIKEYLLCDNCEQRLGRDEDYVSRLAYQENGTLGLIQQLKASAILKREGAPAGSYLRSADVGHLDCGAISRFAASVFWRAHVAKRERPASLKLWKPQSEALRQFVLAKSPLPRGMCLSLIVLVDGEDLTSVHSSTMTMPASGAKGDDSFHQFVVAGLLFHLTIGSFSSPGVCLVCGHRHVIFQNWKTVRVAMDFSKWAISRPLKGRLGKGR
jgi:hypothetical protein